MVSYRLVSPGDRSQGTCLDKAIDFKINRSKTVLSGRGRAKRYVMRKNQGKENYF